MASVVKIPLQNGLYTTIDEADLPLISRFKTWYAIKAGKTLYAVGYDPEKYVPKLRIQKAVKLHRIIMGVTDPKIFIDHIDHDGLNNCRSNMRLSTQRQNQQNRKSAASGSSSKYLGVFKIINKTFVSWRAGIKVDGKMKHLGTFREEIQAAEAYNNAAKMHFKEFSSLNDLSVGKYTRSIR